MRLVEIIVAVNALCGIAAFLIARGMLNKGKRKVRDMFDNQEEELRRKEISERSHSRLEHDDQPY